MNFQKILKNKLFWLFVLIFLFAFLASTFAIVKHYSFNSTIFDLGIFENTLWNSSQLRLFKTSINPWGSFLAYHSSFSLILLVPVYRLFPFTETLLIIQAIFLMLPAWPIYLIAKEKLNSGKIAFIIGSVYLLYPAIHHVALNDFHEISFAPFFILFAFYFLEKKDNLKYFVFLAIAFLVKEEIALLGLVFAAYLFIKKRYKVSLATFLVSFSWFILAVYFIIPFFASGEYIHISNKYGEIGNSLLDVAGAFFTKPGLVIDTILIKAKAVFTWRIFFPVAFLPLAGWQIFLPFLPLFIAYHLLSTGTRGLYSITSHYVPFSLAIIFIAVILGLKNLRDIKKCASFVKYLVIIIIMLSIYSFLRWSPYPFSGYYQPDINFKKVVKSEVINKVRNLIPGDASLSAENNIGPHFIKRETIYMFPKIEDAEYVLTDESNFRFNSEEKRDKVYSELKRGNDFELIFSEKTIELYKRK